MNFSLQIECDDYAELQLLLSGVKDQIRKRRQLILSETEPVITHEENDTFWGTSKWELEVFDQAERDLENLAGTDQPSDEIGVLHIKFKAPE